jgi:hypothetical protein
MVTLILLAFNVAFAYLTIRTAEKRGRSANAWAWLGFVFGPFAWLTVALLPSIQEDRTA